MVSILRSEKNAQKVDVKLDIQDVYDIINGVNILVGMKEEEMNKHGSDPVDQEQYKRYRELLAEMQEVKALFK